MPLGLTKALVRPDPRRIFRSQPASRRMDSRFFVRDGALQLPVSSVDDEKRRQKDEKRRQRDDKRRNATTVIRRSSRVVIAEVMHHRDGEDLRVTTNADKKTTNAEALTTSAD